MNPRLRALIAALLVALAAFVTGANLGTSDDSSPPPAPPSAPQGDTEQAGPLPTGNPAESDLRDELPGKPGVVRSILPAEKIAPGPPLPTGGSQNYDCKRDFSGGVFSSRRGAKPRLFVWHYTVSPNVKGWGDIYGVQGYFKRTRVGSSHFIVDFEGHCLQMVPIANSAWTQGRLNPISISVEIIATGGETRAQWLASPLIKDGILAELTRDQSRANGLAVRWFDPVGCSPSGTGTTDHDHLECNDHTDVRGLPVDVVTAQLQNGPDAVKPLPARYEARCKALNKLRRSRARRLRAHTTPTLTARQRRRASELRRNFSKRKVVCSSAGVRRA